PDPVGPAQDAHVDLHLSLVVEQRGVAAGAGRQPLDVVRDLALEELGRLASGEPELAPGRAIHNADGLAKQLVLGGLQHGPIVATGIGFGPWRSPPTSTAPSRRFRPTGRTSGWTCGSSTRSATSRPPRSSSRSTRSPIRGTTG